MKDYEVLVLVLPRAELRDPEGETISKALSRLGIEAKVRAGRAFQLVIRAADAQKAQRLAERAARELLANPVVEDFRVEVLGPII